MARIPTAELERLKESISVVRLVESAGVELKAHGAHLADLASKRPAFSLAVERFDSGD